MSEIKVLKFGAEWCGPCRVLDPIIDGLKEKYEDIIFESINVDDSENNEISQEYGIRSIPAVFILKDGKTVDKFVGFKDEDSIKELLDKASKEESEDESEKK